MNILDNFLRNFRSNKNTRESAESTVLHTPHGDLNLAKPDDRRKFGRMVKHGFPLKGLRFEWNDAVDYTPEQQIQYETMIADRYEVEPSYFADKYGMPVGERIGGMPALLPADGGNRNDSPGDGGRQRNARRFFD